MNHMELVGDHFQYIRTAVLSRCKSRNNRDEIVGIVVLHMISETERFDPRLGSFKNFLTSRIGGRVIDAIRSLGAYGNKKRHGWRFPLPGAQFEKDPKARTPEAQRAESELMDLVTVYNAPVGPGVVIGKTLAELPERWRRVLEMQFSDGATQDEIAKELGINQSRVSQITRQALAEMRRLLEARGVRKVADVL